MLPSPLRPKSDASPSNAPQLARLASQHHASDYSRAKFGVHGAPVPYLPISLHAPDHFAQLCARQALTDRLSAWCPAPDEPDTCPSVSLHDQLMAAISEPLSMSSQAQVKTSRTHPINISCIIPLDLLDLISSHALLSQSAPSLLDIPPSFTLDRLSSLRDTRLQALQPLPSPKPPCRSAYVKQTPQSHFRTRSHVSDALHAALNSGIAQDTHICTDQVTLTRFPDSNLSVSLSMSIPTSAALFSKSSRPSIPPFSRMPSMTMIPKAIPYRQHSQIPPAFTIGNLFLSSCPGKKVRLDGPVKGRSAVCRDLETDMRRMKELGVGCVVCCLDNDELEFLGAPWPQYAQCAKQSGIDVLRLPIPEGLAPTSAAFLDTHLVDIINRYTLLGVPVLVHCRGGVGRAGVVACCWLIRLGLCGWLDNATTINSAQNGLANVSALTAAPQQDPIPFVEKVITLVRRRRSAKAVETYEQVKFLVEYVEHLQRETASLPSPSLPQTPL
ncbi:phosphatases II [Pholiota conissans]|uniref:Phosphatases II n=1 Tax=Pholiota conissans TaxID=109636 RepID=A0A9P5ZC72_9AGAR|nr:phosphatases II [Pholiota conissans]